ncbi:MAG: DUF4214 domain-containing protein [Bdellovibrionaceae bacterium]|nr:DUF4214 domain-containing protein [Pseudobdellovibrionaceae bacterium]
MRSLFFALATAFSLLFALGCSPLQSLDESSQSSNDLSLLTSANLNLTPFASPQEAIYAWPYMAPLIGTAHTAAQYDPNGLFDAKIMIRGAMDARLLGFNSLKIWVDPNSPSGGNFRARNPNVHPDMLLADLIEQPEFVETFNMPFKAFFLEVDDHIAAANIENRFLSEAEIADIDHEIYQLTRRLIQNHAGTGRVFLIQNHEGDNHLADFGNARYAVKEPNVVPPTSVAYANYERYFKTRQAAVRRARIEAGARNVAVYHVCEVNAVVRTYRPDLLAGLRQAAEAAGQTLLTTSLTTEVLPRLDCDAYGYSAYDATHQSDVHVLAGALEYIRQHTQPSAAFGRNNVMVTEFGIPENKSSPADIIAYASRVQYWLKTLNIPAFVAWQMYDNECQTGNSCLVDFNGAHLNTEDDGLTMGFWMRKASGSLGLLYQGMQPFLALNVSDYEVGIWSYRLLLGREPSWEEASAFPVRIYVEGGRANFFRNVAGSEEARRKVVSDVFQKLFARAPTEHERSEWAARVRGRTLGLAANDLLRQGTALILDGAPAPEPPRAPVPAPLPPPSESSVEAAQAFIARMYRALLQREVDASGMDHLTDLYRQRTFGAAGLAVQILESDEYFAQASRISNEVFLQRVYRGLFEREPDLAGLSVWISQLNTGAISRMQIEETILASPEFQSFCQAQDLICSPGAARGRTAVNPHAKATPVRGDGRTEDDLEKRRAFVRGLYQKLYQRAPDEAGVKFHAEGRQTCVELSISFVQAPEFVEIGRKLSGAKFVSRLYEGLYRRVGDTAGVLYWAPLIDKGTLTRAQVADDFLANPELITSCEAAGLPR